MYVAPEQTHPSSAATRNGQPNHRIEPLSVPLMVDKIIIIVVILISIAIPIVIVDVRARVHTLVSLARRHRKPTRRESDQKRETKRCKRGERLRDRGRGEAPREGRLETQRGNRERCNDDDDFFLTFRGIRSPCTAVQAHMCGNLSGGGAKHEC